MRALVVASMFVVGCGSLEQERDLMTGTYLGTLVKDNVWSDGDTLADTFPSYSITLSAPKDDPEGFLLPGSCIIPAHITGPGELEVDAATCPAVRFDPDCTMTGTVTGGKGNGTKGRLYLEWSTTSFIKCDDGWSVSGTHFMRYTGTMQ